MIKYIFVVFSVVFGGNLFAQNIQFPEDFKCDHHFFKEPLLDPLPDNSQTKGFKGNPGLITDTLVIKRLQPDYAKIGMGAIYYQYYGARTASSALHVIQYKTIAKREEAMKKFDASERTSYLAIDRYIIMIGIVEEEGRGTQIDALVQFYQDKLNAELFLERLKEVQIVSVKQQETTRIEPPKNRTDFQKLDENEIKRFFKLETKKHKLGRVAMYHYFPERNTEIETAYEVQNGELTFYWEDVYRYNELDSLLCHSRYSEIPSAEYPQFMEDKYTYYQDHYVKTHSFDGKVQDSVYTYFKKNASGKIVSEIEFTKSHSSNFSYARDSVFVKYAYDELGDLTSKKTKTNSYEKEYRYEYENGKLKKKSFIADHYISEEMYNKDGQLVEEIERYPQNESNTSRSVFVYNKKGWKVRRETYQNGKLVSKHNYKNDDKGREIKYEMGKGNGIWLYEYDEKNRLKYKIDLYTREEKPQETKEYRTMGAPTATD